MLVSIKQSKSVYISVASCGLRCLAPLSCTMEYMSAVQVLVEGCQIHEGVTFVDISCLCCQERLQPARECAKTAAQHAADHRAAGLAERQPLLRGETQAPASASKQQVKSRHASSCLMHNRAATVCTTAVPAVTSSILTSDQITCHADSAATCTGRGWGL